MIYTKKGDKGETGLFKGGRISKDSPLIGAIGVIDEANSWLGVVGGLEEIQKDLMTISSILAGAKQTSLAPACRTGRAGRVTELEKEIDRMEKLLRPLSHFILPGGGGKGAKLHFARTLVRRAEREVVAIRNLKLEIRNSIIPYLNRLSDYLFILARYMNKTGKYKEKVWKLE